MSTSIRAGVVVFYGANCDHDSYHVLKDVLGVRTDYIWHASRDLSDYQIVVLPGGFSYGDYLRVGAIARFTDVMKALPEFIERERGFVVGICNGFQILIEAGLLPGALTRNVDLKFICKNVKLRVQNADTPFTSLFEEGDIVEAPIAHSDGRYHAPNDVYSRIVDHRQVLLTYHGDNPNGSLGDVAGLVNERGNVFGMMPHPERNSETILGTGDGLRFFQSLRNALESA
jgi:phosphoribosylformylglycinamidine synthase